MAIPDFQFLENSLGGALVDLFGNRVMISGGVQFQAVLDSDILPMGEYDLTQRRQDLISIDKAAAPTLKQGDTVAMDPAYYTSAELAEYPKTSWKVDRKESDDGHLVKWWLT